MTNPKKNRKILNLVLAVILAVGVWLYVINVENPTSPTTVRDVPVTVTGEDVLAERDLMVTHLSAESVDLRISGRKKTLMNLNRSNVSLELDVSTITAAGDHTLTCQYEFPRNVGSDSVSISDWEDLRITVTVAQRESKEIPVRGEFIGTEAENSLAGSVTTNPETVEVSGPAEALEDAELSDGDAAKYLRGEEVPSACGKGWCAATWHGFALGLGKSVGGVMKNKYPKSLRRP